MILCCLVILAQCSIRVEDPLSDAQAHPLESGFERLRPALSVSTPFFFLAVLFVLFDVEVILLLPSVFFHLLSQVFIFNVFLLVIMLVILTVFVEWA